MAVTSATTRLGCGRDIDQIWENLDRVPDAHERSCPYCQAARADLSRLADATHDLRRADADDPALTSDPAMVARVLDIARAEVRRGRRLPLDEPDPAQMLQSGATVSEQAVATVIRRVGDELPGVEVRRCAARLSPAPSPTSGTATGTTAGAPIGPVPARVVIDLEVGIGLGLPVPALAQELRDRVRGRVERDIGVQVTRVDIVVGDVLDA